MYTDRIEKLREPLEIAQKEARLLALQQLVHEPNLWDDQERAVALTSELTAIEKALKNWRDVVELNELSADLSESELADLEKEVRGLEQQALLSGHHDAAGAIVTVHAGTGGTDAQDWAQMLQRMFMRFVEQGKTEQVEDRVLAIDRNDWKLDIIDENRGEEAGIKKATFEVSGAFAFGLLKSEAGVHRLVRQSPFNAKGLRQTSFALVEVIPAITQETEVSIPESELEIDVFRSGGAGGQHVNTTDSAVRLTHKPSGIVVVVQNERSQHQNKATALKILGAKLLRLQELKNAEEIAMLKGEVKEGSWGNQIRSYVLHPYQMVKDHRTSAETSQTAAVLDGDLTLFIEAYLLNPNE